MRQPPRQGVLPVRKDLRARRTDITPDALQPAPIKRIRDTHPPLIRYIPYIPCVLYVLYVVCVLYVLYVVCVPSSPIKNRNSKIKNPPPLNPNGIASLSPALPPNGYAGKPTNKNPQPGTGWIFPRSLPHLPRCRHIRRKLDYRTRRLGSLHNFIGINICKRNERMRHYHAHP